MSSVEATIHGKKVIIGGKPQQVDLHEKALKVAEAIKNPERREAAVIRANTANALKRSINDMFMNDKYPNLMEKWRREGRNPYPNHAARAELDVEQFKNLSPIEQYRILTSDIYKSAIPERRAFFEKKYGIDKAAIEAEIAKTQKKEAPAKAIDQGRIKLSDVKPISQTKQRGAGGGLFGFFKRILGGLTRGLRRQMVKANLIAEERISPRRHPRSGRGAYTVNLKRKDRSPIDTSKAMRTTINGQEVLVGAMVKGNGR